MSDLTVDISDYLTDEEINGLVKEGVRNAAEDEARSLFRTSPEVFITNCAYYEVIKIASENCGDDLRKLIADKIPDIVDNLSSFSVFYRDRYLSGSVRSPNAQLLDQVVFENKPLIDAKVKGLIGNLDAYDIKDALMAALETSLSSVLGMGVGDE